MEVKAQDLPLLLSFEDLREYTDDFSPQNYIGEFHFGKVYHGKIPLKGWANPKPVTVKIWEIPTKYGYYDNDNTNRLMDEVIFLQQKKIVHPMLMKLYGFCCEPERCGVVYDFKSFGTLFKLIPGGGGDNFTWLQRMKVALNFAHFLRYVHRQNHRKRPLLIRNIDAAHIMVDEDWNPKLYDFSMITGGMFPDRTLLKIQHVHGTYGYREPREWSEKTDVYGFGVVLLCLMTKEVYTDEERLNFKSDVADRSRLKYMKHMEEGGNSLEMSLVHKSFEADESFYTSDAPTITQLALSCVISWPDQRPQMEHVVNVLERLKVVSRNLNVFD